MCSSDLKVDDPLSDPVGWARARGLSQEEQLLLGQSLLYDLAPNKAPADMRIRLLEAKMAREKRAEQEQAQRNQSLAAQRQNQNLINQFAEEIETFAGSLPIGSFPESEDFYGDDSAQYVQDLLNHARVLATGAAKAGRRVDLSPEAVAKSLEADLVKRLSRRGSRAAVAPTTAESKKSPEIGRAHV